MPDPTLRDQWAQLLKSEEGRTALMQFGVSLLNPPRSFGGNFGTELGNAIGETGTAVGRVQETQRQQAQQAREAAQADRRLSTQEAAVEANREATRQRAQTSREGDVAAQKRAETQAGAAIKAANIRAGTARDIAQMQLDADSAGIPQFVLDNVAAEQTAHTEAQGLLTPEEQTPFDLQASMRRNQILHAMQTGEKKTLTQLGLTPAEVIQNIKSGAWKADRIRLILDERDWVLIEQGLNVAAIPQATASGVVSDKANAPTAEGGGGRGF